MNQILNRFEEEKFTIGNSKMVQLNADCASHLFIQEIGNSTTMLPALVESITSTPVVVFELFGRNAVRRLMDVVGKEKRFYVKLNTAGNKCYNNFVGPDDPNEAKQLYPNSIRAKFGASLVKNIIFCSNSATSANQVIVYYCSMTQRKTF